MNTFAATGIGCVAALALWKGTRERWVPSLLGMFVIVVTVKYSFQADDFGWAIWMAGYAIFTAGTFVLRRYDRCTAESRPFFSKAESWKQSRSSPEPTPIEPLRCHWGYKYEGHYIGPNEPYRFLDEEGNLKGRPDTTGARGRVCLDCIQKRREEVRELLARGEKICGS